MGWRIEFTEDTKGRAIERLTNEFQSPEAEKTYPPSWTNFAKTIVAGLPEDHSQRVSVLVVGNPTPTDPAGASVRIVIGRVPFGAPEGSAG